MKKLTLGFIVAIVCLAGCKKNNETSPALSEKKIVAEDFLSSKEYKSVIVDLVYDRNYPPDETTLTNIRSFLNNRLNKPEGITITLHQIEGTGKEMITLTDVKEMEKKYRLHYSGESILTVFVYLAGADYVYSQGNSKILGINYDATSIVLFGKTLKSFSGGITGPSYSTLETTVAEHELAHAFGLVNNGVVITSAHEDKQHPQHCVNKDCLMYYQAETSDIVANLLGGKIPELDSSCLADLQNAGGK